MPVTLLGQARWCLPEELQIQAPDYRTPPALLPQEVRAATLRPWHNTGPVSTAEASHLGRRRSWAEEVPEVCELPLCWSCLTQLTLALIINSCPSQLHWALLVPREGGLRNRWPSSHFLSVRRTAWMLARTRPQCSCDLDAASVMFIPKWVGIPAGGFR